MSQYVGLTDGTYTLSELHRMERYMLRKLQWRLAPVTHNTWANVYLNRERRQQAGSMCQECQVRTNECYHGFPRAMFSSIMEVVDLVILDTESTQFSPSVLVASVYASVRPMQPSHVHAVTGYTIKDLSACMRWLRNYMSIGCRQKSSFQQNLRDVNLNERHTVQVHYPDARSIIDQFALKAD